MRYLFLVCCAALVGAAERAETGFFTTSFTERHPSSAFEVLGKRYGWTGKPAERDVYDLAKETFEVCVPTSYDGTIAYGLIVYTNSGSGGNHHEYASLMEKYHLIWIGATNVPNERSVAARWGLALDATWNMPKRYNIDPKRVYAVGNSGGGRCSSRIAPTWPEAFTGGIYLVGCNPPLLPSDKVLAAKALAGRYALVTGSDDSNRKDTQGVLNSYRNMKFAHVEYFEQPGLGHSNPNGEWFTKALTFVDAPLIAEAAALVAKAQTHKAKKPYEAAALLLGVVRDYPVAEVQVAAAKADLAILTPVVEGLLKAEMTTLGAGSKAKWRAMSDRTRGFSCHEQAHATADGFGQQELVPVIATANPKNLLKFSTEWAGYPCAIQAETVYDQLAATALDAIRAQPADKRTKTLVKYLKDWEDCPSRRVASALFEDELNAQLALLLSLDKGRDAKLIAFVKQWPGTAAGNRAIAVLTPPDPKAEKAE